MAVATTAEKAKIKKRYGCLRENIMPLVLSTSSQNPIGRYSLLEANSKIGFWRKISRRKSAGQERGTEF